MKTNHAFKSVLAILFFHVSCVAKADLLVYEGFDYEVGSILEGQSGGIGFGDSWQRRYSSNGDQTVVPGLVFSDYPVLGKAVLSHAEKSSGSFSPCGIRALSADFASSAPVWSSCLFSYTVSPGKKPAYFGSMNTCNNKAPDDRRFSVSGLNGSNRIGASYQSPGGSGGSATLSASTTYLLIGKYVGDVGMTMWVLSTANYDAIKAEGITEAELDATNSGKVIDKFVDGDDNTLENYLGISSSTFGEDSSVSVTFDELRLATSLADLISPVRH